MFVALKVSENHKKILEIATAETRGEAYRKAQDFTSQGFVACVVPDAALSEYAYLARRIEEQRELGFNKESGRVPGGKPYHKHGGVRGIGRMIHFTPRELEELKASPKETPVEDEDFLGKLKQLVKDYK